MSDQTPPDPYAVPPAGGYPPPPVAGPVPPVAPPAVPDPATPPGGYPPPPPAGYPAPTYPAAGYPGGQAPKPGAGTLSIVALVIAIVALIFCWFPFIGGGAALIALILGIAAWVSAKGAGRPTGLAIAATMISILALIIGVVISIAVIALIDEAQKADKYCNSVSANQAEYDQCMEDRVSTWLRINTTR
jgi:hypothetical protein